MPSKVLTPTPRQELLISCPADTIFFGGARGGGKGHGVTDLVLTPYGFRLVGSLKIGDTITGSDGRPQKIIQIFELGERDLYDVEFIDGGHCRCTDDHLWKIKKTFSRSKKPKIEGEDDPTWHLWTFKMIREFLDKKEQADENATIKNQNLLIPLCGPVKFTKSYKYDMRPIDPYHLGLLLGDGCLTKQHQVSFTKPDMELIDALKEKYTMTFSCRCSWYVSGNDLLNDLRKLGLLGTRAETKFIPESYKLSTIEDRMALMQGLLDTDGTADDRGHISYCTTSYQLAKDIQWVVWSLGGKATITESPGWYRDPETGERVDCQMSYDVYINTPFNTKMFRLKRKKERCRDDFNGGVSELHRRIVGYKYAGREQARCIQVSNADALYIAGDFAVTHNTYGDGLLILDRVNKYGRLFRSLFIRRFRPELEDAIDQFMEMFGSFATWKGVDNTFVFWNGARLKMGYIEKAEDIGKFQGKQYALIIFDEVTNFADFNIVERMRGCLRNSHGFPNQLIMTGNPGGPLHMRMKTMFIEPAPKGDVLIKDGWSDDMGRYLYKCFIPSRVKDNPYLSNDYVDQLKRSGTPEQVKQWLEGCWDDVENPAFSDLFTPYVHVVRNFSVPPNWRLFKSYDYGSSKPWACTWFAESDGSDFIAADGRNKPTIKGDVFAVAELYGCVEGRVNEGTKESIKIQAEKIKLVEEVFFKDFKIAQSIADSAIFAKQSGNSISDEFERNGVYWEPCQKFPGFRHQGYVLLRERLLASIERNEKPGIFWMARCRNAIRTIPALQMDRREVDCVATNNSSEDHIYDETVYFLQSHKDNTVKSGATGVY